jgi:AbrB family looped-hinge helix DNA binding protein
MKAVLSEKGQVTIPKALRDRLGLRPGQVLEFREERGRLIGTKRNDVDPIGKAYGILKMGETTDEAIRRLRGRVDAT